MTPRVERENAALRSFLFYVCTSDKRSGILVAVDSNSDETFESIHCSAPVRPGPGRGPRPPRPAGQCHPILKAVRSVTVPFSFSGSF
eukprot:767887-Hanusia_phi.AAC.6